MIQIRLKGDSVTDVIVGFTIVVIEFTRRVVCPGDPVKLRPPFPLALIDEGFACPCATFGSINKQIFQIEASLDIENYYTLRLIFIDHVISLNTNRFVNINTLLVLLVR
ncbi:Uncharacterised protein [Enterobacter hormaechei]|nr:Uncharacterised protein [Enterobacter hormaechei]